jgi:hypothetical protein
MRRCKACGQEFRKGTIALVLTSKGTKGATVCPSCAKGGTLIVAAGQETVTRIEVKKLSTRRLVAHLAALARVARAQSDQIRGNMDDDLKRMHDARAEGLETAIQAIKSGRFMEGE